MSKNVEMKQFNTEIAKNYIKNDNIEVFSYVKETTNFPAEYYKLILNYNMRKQMGLRVFTYIFENNLIDPNDESVYGYSILAELVNIDYCFDETLLELKLGVLLKYGANINHIKYCDYSRCSKRNHIICHLDMTKVDYSNSASLDMFKGKTVSQLFDFETNVVKIQINSNISTCTVCPILVAVLNNNEFVINLLIKNGAKLNIKDDKNNTILHYFTQLKYVTNDKLLKFLLENIDINAKNIEGKTCVHSLFNAYNLCMSPNYIKLMLRSGYDVTIQDNKGNTATHSFASKTLFYDSVTSVIKKLVKNNPKIINIKNLKGNNLLYLSAKQGYYILIKYCLKYKHNPDIFAINNKGKSIFGKLMDVNFKTSFDPPVFIKMQKLAVAKIVGEKKLGEKFTLLYLGQQLDEGSLFHKDYLPRDMFNLITKCFKFEKNSVLFSLIKDYDSNNFKVIIAALCVFKSIRGSAPLPPKVVYKILNYATGWFL